ncbi:MAG TPA: hypothetical protein VL475_02105, partial [Planctomycetaceae bacterium]|nr:hypothetical protein [Planctomycetaceae bacterium]
TATVDFRGGPLAGKSTIPMMSGDYRPGGKQCMAGEAVTHAYHNGVGSRFFCFLPYDESDRTGAPTYEIVEFRAGDHPEVVCRWIESKKPD